MFTITKKFSFSASHRLTGLPNEHKCARLHGHNYSVEVVLRSPKLNNVGFVRDYGDLGGVQAYLDKFIEHRHLNEVFIFNPTAENLARMFYEIFWAFLPELIAVTVKETDKTSATYEP